MTTSVCMGTYNGEKYITEQLYSILHQTKAPDEVILCDDGSSDKTVEYIQKFIAQNNLAESWHLYQNAENKGYPANFYYACSLCTGDIVFLADQDDIWAERKLEHMCQVMEERSMDVKVLACKFGLIDENGADIHTVMAPTQNNGTGELHPVTVEDMFYKYVWPGMVVAFQNDWYKEWAGNNADSDSHIPHDFHICAKAAEENHFFQMDEELAYHRRHDNNVGGEEHRLRKLLNKERKIKEIEDYLHILENFEKEKVFATKKAHSALSRKRQTMNQRLEALKSGKISKVFANAWRNKKDVRLATAICDMLIVRK